MPKTPETSPLDQLLAQLTTDNQTVDIADKIIFLDWMLHTERILPTDRSELVNLLLDWITYKKQVRSAASDYLIPESLTKPTPADQPNRTQRSRPNRRPTGK